MLDKFEVQNYHLKGLVHEFKYVDKNRQTLVKIPFLNLLDSTYVEQFSHWRNNTNWSFLCSTQIGFQQLGNSH